MFHGIRYDIASILVVNVLFILLHIIPNPFRETIYYQRTLKILFYVFNGIALMFESGDFIYFPYGLQRTSMHELGLTNDTSILPQVLKDFWYIFIIVTIIIIGIEYLYRKTEIQYKKHIKIKPVQIHYPVQLAIMCLLVVASLIGARGGVGPDPISPQSAANMVNDERLSELVINTPFSVLYAVSHRKVEEPNFFNDSDLKNMYSMYHENVQFYKPPDQQNDAPKNICVIVLESFSKEYIGYFNPKRKGYTPFLDSLLQQGLCFTNAYSNGKSSNQGIIAITSGVPVLMPEPLISSVYGVNDIDGVGSYLKEKGYKSYFFHGANNGSMGFDFFMERCGMSGYFGRNEYDNDADFDGNWGIFDEPFLKWTANTMTNFQQPFFTEIFTISSHHPFTVPKEYKGKFKKGPIPMLEVVGYADYALEQFFIEAKKQPWFNNTLFILVPDHPGPPIPGDAFYQNQVGAHSSWMLLYKPDGEFTGTTDMVVQHSDILPTVLDYAGYKGKYMAFGNSIFDTTAHRLAFNYHSNDFMLLDDYYVLQYNGIKTEGLFAYKQDSLLQNNLSETLPDIKDKMEDKLKAIIQVHHHAMIHNKLLPQ
ncbi:MAG: LTA synthase family protein [Fimbriimonadaceae bacterium]|nr:LTA synthase family protein [Chitinophagales bacterium]